MFLYRVETKDCRVFPNDTITELNTSMAGVQYRLYALRHTRRVLYFFTTMYYKESSETCQAYGGRLYTPRTQDEVMMLQKRRMFGFVGLTKFTGHWVDSAGQLYEEPSLWHSLYPIGNGNCARVQDGYLIDCNCRKRERRFVCDVLYESSEGSSLG
uniref:C-type lectin domain-containing protein n=1 Tax=Scylla olivacea TaxID=85551 RepID=A0A0P4WK72_SCYOL